MAAVMVVAEEEEEEEEHPALRTKMRPLRARFSSRAVCGQDRLLQPPHPQQLNLPNQTPRYEEQHHDAQRGKGLSRGQRAIVFW